MNFFVIILISLASMFNLVISESNKIFGYRCEEWSHWKYVEFLCDENYKNGTAHFTNLVCYRNYTKSQVERVNFDCSIPYFGTYFEDY